MKSSLPTDQVQEVYTAEYYFAEIFLIVKLHPILFSLIHVGMLCVPFGAVNFADIVTCYVLRTVKQRKVLVIGNISVFI
jgi:hypothetical protein